VLFIVIIGGLGSISGAFLGSAFIVLTPIALDVLGGLLLGRFVDPGLIENVQKILFGVLIVFFLIKEPEGFARLLQLARQKLRTFPLVA
jgi:branched-chain amino acid transport system permease protein